MQPTIQTNYADRLLASATDWSVSASTWKKAATPGLVILAIPSSLIETALSALCACLTTACYIVTTGRYGESLREDQRLIAHHICNLTYSLFFIWNRPGSISHLVPTKGFINPSKENKLFKEAAMTSSEVYQIFAAAIRYGHSPYIAKQSLVSRVLYLCAVPVGMLECIGRICDTLNENLLYHGSLHYYGSEVSCLEAQLKAAVCFSITINSFVLVFFNCIKS